MRQVVVLPFVPVTMTAVTPRESLESMSGQTRRAILPGSAVPPRPASLSTRRTSLQSSMAKKSLMFYRTSLQQLISRPAASRPRLASSTGRTRSVI